MNKNRASSSQIIPVVSVLAELSLAKAREVLSVVMTAKMMKSGATDG